MRYKVLVAGGGGFLGSYVVKMLLERGHEVRVVDNWTSTTSLRSSPDSVESINGDLCDPQVAKRACQGMDICILLAAICGGIAFFNARPASILDQNLRILCSTFSAAKENGLRRIIYVSSSCVFDRCQEHPVKEQDVLTCPAPPPGYPLSKLVGEAFCIAYLQEFGLEYTIVRPFNAYGPGEYPRERTGLSHVIPDLSLKVLRGDYPLEILGDGFQTRSFTHASDVAQGVLLALEDPKALNEDFNLGGSPEISIADLARMLWTISDRREPFRMVSQGNFEQDVRRRAVDRSKAEELLGWVPQVELSEGLADYMYWLQGQTPMVLA